MRYSLLVTAVLMMAGCYMEVSDAVSSGQTIELDFQQQAPVGYAGDGYYIVAKAYDSSDVSSMFNDGNNILRL